MKSGISFGSVWVPLIAVVALFAALASLRPPSERLWGDEGTYVAMTASLVRDGDLLFGETDRAWAERREPGVGVTVILQRTARGVAYSKPVLYPLLAAPFYLLLGEPGIVALHVAIFAAALALAWRVLRRRGSGEMTALTLLTYSGCGVLLPYLLWRVSDLVQFALALGGLLLACDGLRRGEPRGSRAPLVGGALLGLLATMRLPAAALAAAAVAAALLHRRPRRALLVGGSAVLAFLLLLGAGRVLTGSANPYKAVRASFNGELGYPAGSGAERAGERFESHPATQRIGWHPAGHSAGGSARTLYSSLYFAVGRHTGLLLYFPMALLLAARILFRPDRTGLALAAGVAAIVLFYLIWMPWNYFGGSTFVGNRYFLVGYAALLAAAPGLPSGRQLVPIWLLAATAGISALYSVEASGDADRMSQTHAYGGVYRLLPYETTAQEIDGQRDRYWAGDFVRFVDPFAAVDAHSFELDSEAPPAELVVATDWSGDPLKLLVTSAAGPLELRVADWGRRRWHRLAPGPGGVSEVVEIDPSPAWRHHGYWWSPTAGYDVRTLRLKLLTGDGSPARARVRYLGDGSALERSAERRVLSVRLPRRTPAGGLSELRLRVRNRGDWTWTSDDVAPLYLSYRLRGPDAVSVEGPRSRIERPVPPGGVLDARMRIAWPDAPGRYTLEVDLVLEHLFWFGDRVGEPLVRVEVTLPG